MNLLDVCQFIIHMSLNSTEGNFEKEVIWISNLSFFSRIWCLGEFRLGAVYQSVNIPVSLCVSSV